MSENKSESIKNENKSIKNDEEKKNSSIDDSNSSYDSSEIEQEAEKINVSKEFEENVIKYVKYDNAIRKKNEELKELKGKRKPCEDFILSYLEKIDEKEIEITGGKLRRNKSETKQSVNTDIIKKTLTDKLNNPKLVGDILKEMENNRLLKTHINLKRTGKRSKKKN